MQPSRGCASPLWLWAVPLAWGTSAAILVPELRVSLFAAGISLACLRAASRRVLVIWAIALALPGQAIAGIMLELRGPLHFHARAGAAHYGHAHQGIERHHHAVDEQMVRVGDEDSGTKQNKAPSIGLDALPPSARAFMTTAFTSVARERADAFSLRYCGPPERPPA